MDEGQSGNARGGSRGPSGRVSTSGLVTQSQVDACAELAPADLAALVRGVLETPGLDLRPFTCLKPRQVAELIKLPEWQTLTDAMIGLAVLNKEDRWTKSQWRGLAFFRRTANSTKATKERSRHDFDTADAIEIEAAGDA